MGICGDSYTLKVNFIDKRRKHEKTTIEADELTFTVFYCVLFNSLLLCFLFCTRTTTLFFNKSGGKQQQQTC